MLVVLTLAAIAVTPLVHHHSLDPHSDGDGTTSLQTVCGVCLNARTVLPPEVLSIPPLHAERAVEISVVALVSSPEASVVSSRAPPRYV